MRIVHFSDIHWGKSWQHNRESLEKGVEQIRGLGPDLAIITGDLTDYGLEPEHEGVKAFLDSIGIPYLAVPGNHDAKHAGYKVFERLFREDGGRYFMKEDGEFAFIGLDSSEPDIDEGHIGRPQLEWLEERLVETDKVPIVFLHHHLIPVPNVGRERNVLLDAGSVLRILDEHDVPLALTGHKHFPWLWKVNDMVIANAGTISCERRCCPTSFNIIELEGDLMTIERQLIIEGQREPLGTFEYKKG